jgi:hypothetical protein
MIDQGCLPHWPSLEKADPTHIVFGHCLLYQLLKKCDGSSPAVDTGQTDHDQLRDFLIQAQGLKNAIHPCLGREPTASL